MGFEDGIGLHFVSAFGAGLSMATIGTPLDIVRTRLMNQPAEEKLYNGFLDCFRKIVKTEGPMGLYKGFFPIWGRIAPTTCI